MKKEVVILFGVILIVIISSCSKQESQNISNVSEIGEIRDEKIEHEDLGPSGCRREECEAYCQKNQQVCQQWCQENFDTCKKMCEEYPSACPSDFSRPRGCKTQEECQTYCQNPANYEDCKDLIASQGGQTGFPSGFPTGIQPGFTGPGGCTGPDCATVCSTQPKVCQEWCEKNPQMCAMLMGGGPGGSEAVKPPTATITFAKTVNFNADQFTEQDISKAKELGANMVTIWPSRVIRNDEFVFSLPERLTPMINFAHKNGLQVELRSSFTGEQITNYEKFRINAMKHVAEFARFAEKSRVYRIVPFGEIDNNLMNHCEKITAFSKELLQEMRKQYSGQIGVGIAAPWRDCGYSFEGYDYMTISAYAQSQTGTNAWLTTSPEINVHNVISGTRKVADRSGIKILHVGETGVINPNDTKREDYKSFAMESKQEEAEFYQKFFGQVFDKVNGLSVFYNSRMDYMSINGDPAEEVVKEWYNKLGDTEETTKLIVANPIDLSQIARISKFRSCAGHDYSGLNINLEKEPISSMKHYVEFSKQFLGSKNTVKIFAPFDGKITEVIEAGGKQIFISANKDPKWHFIFFHTSPLPNIQVGATVKSGQLIGYAYVSGWPTFDIAFKQFSFKGEIFDSPFMHMSNGVLKEYELRGVTIKNIIIPKEFRENNPCPIRGIIDGEEAFTGETEKDDFVHL